VSKIFLAYARTDEEFAARLGRVLQAQGVEVSRDMSGANFGQGWEDPLRNALRDADSVVLVLSPAALESAWVAFELGAAAASGKPIVGVQPHAAALPDSLPLPAMRRLNLDGQRLSDAELGAAVRERLAA
jgi:hypothetical protein